MSSKKVITNMDIIREMTLMDDIFMTVVFENRPDCVEDILRIILSFEPKVEKVETQYDYSSVYGRSVKFDILARDKDNTLYDIEIQRANKGAVPKRARYHSSMLDTKALDKNEDFEQLRETYVIFITEHDILGNNIPVYRIERVITDTNKFFNDGEHIIYINTAYKGMDVTEIEKLIHDFKCRDPKEMFIESLRERCRDIKSGTAEKEADKMCELLEQKIKQERAEGIAEGKAEGKAEGRAEGRINVAENMLLTKQFSNDIIAKLCDLTVEEVEKLKEKLSA